MDGDDDGTDEYSWSGCTGTHSITQERKKKQKTTRSALLHSENRTESAGSAHYKRKGYLYSNKKNLRVNYDNDVALGPYWRSTSIHVHTHTHTSGGRISFLASPFHCVQIFFCFVHCFDCWFINRRNPPWPSHIVSLLSATVAYRPVALLRLELSPGQNNR
jgi:hypothetical protein